MREFAKWFYNSPAWKSTRVSYMKKAGGLCERCLKKGLYTPAEIVHHKIWLNEENIHDPKIALSFDNLEALCRPCHEEEHSEANRKAKQKHEKRYTVDAEGHVIARETDKSGEGTPPGC